MAEVTICESLSPIERLIVYITLHSWVNFVILPLFILSNAQINLSFKDINSYYILYLCLLY
ncbi:Na+/H+ antiporter NhaA [Francisella persica]|uniref:Na+/H+ antiporter NhaA n=1 Tax=Francisella persica TaxID=954 RepID=UPI00118752DE